MKKTGYSRQIEHDQLDRLIAGLARRQHGHVTRAQLLDLGANRNAIHYRVEVGRLIRVYAGVYAVGHLPGTPVARAAAAVLASGAGAVLSHGSAAALWGFRNGWPQPTEVTTPSARRRAGILAHRSSTLTREDVTTHYAIKVTSPARTVYDIAPSLTDKALIRAVNDALLSNYLRPAHLVELIERNPAHQPRERWTGLLSQTGPTRSDLEDAFSAFTRRFGLPVPLINTRVAGREVDALFADHGVIVELDSWLFHRSRAAFESDRDRDAQMLMGGLPTVRVTWERLTSEPEREAERLRAILARRTSYGPLKFT